MTQIKDKLTIEELGNQYELSQEQQKAILCWLAWHLWHIQNPSDGPTECKSYDPLTIDEVGTGYIAASYVLLESGRRFSAIDLNEIEQRLMDETLPALARQETLSITMEDVIFQLQQSGIVPKES